MREHVFVRRDDSGWHLSGLLDFEPSMLGAAAYALASVGIFLAGGDPQLLRAFLLVYGYTDTALTAELRRTILLYVLLHRYGNLRKYLERIPPKQAATLPALADEWFAFE